MNGKILFSVEGTFLYLEQVLVTFDVPIFYVCRDTLGCRYSVLCLDSDEGEYLISQVSRENLIDMLEDRITLRDFAKAGTSTWRVRCGESYDSDVSERLKVIPEEDLPESGAYYELGYQNDIKDYLHLLKSELPYASSFALGCTCIIDQVIDNYMNKIKVDDTYYWNEYGKRQEEWISRVITDRVITVPMNEGLA